MSVKRIAKTERTTSGLCEALFQEFDLLRDGESDAKRATAISKMSAQIIATKKLEIEAARLAQGGLNVSDIALSGKGVKLVARK